MNASFTFNNMVGRNYGDNGLDWEGKDPNAYVYFEGFGAGYDFIETMGMHMAAGRSFSKDFGDENSKIILNEAAVNMMHLKDPVGKNIKLFGTSKQIIGVVKDFHFESLHETVKPSYIVLQRQGANPWFKIMVRIKSGQQQQTIAAIQHFMKAYNPGFPFHFNFLDEAYQKQYDTETRVAALSKYFAGLAIYFLPWVVWSCSFHCAKKKKRNWYKESYRRFSCKYHSHVIKRFFKAGTYFIVIAFPVSWWGMNNWLQSFAYRINIAPEVFVIAGASIILSHYSP